MPAAADWPIVVADAADTASVDALAASTRVVATTVGPYAKYGKPLVAACAESGTHYADLTGEVGFVRDVIDSFDGPQRPAALASSTAAVSTRSRPTSGCSRCTTECVATGLASSRTRNSS